MFGFIMKGGFLMWPILLCSVFSIAIIIERLYSFHRSGIKVPDILPRVKTLLKEGKADEALKACEGTGDPLAHILSIGIRIRKRGREEQEKMISRAGTRIIREMEKHLRGLVIIGNIAPLLGLLGTVTGMIKTFIKIQESGGRADASVLAGGIWEALVTTAAGLSVAIPALVAYHYFEGKVDNIGARMKDGAGELMEAGYADI